MVKRLIILVIGMLIALSIGCSNDSEERGFDEEAIIEKVDKERIDHVRGLNLKYKVLEGYVEEEGIENEFQRTYTKDVSGRDYRIDVYRSVFDDNYVYESTEILREKFLKWLEGAVEDADIEYNEDKEEKFNRNSEYITSHEYKDKQYYTTYMLGDNPDYVLSAYYFYDKENVIEIELMLYGDVIEIDNENGEVNIPVDARNDLETMIKSLIELN